MWKSGQLVTINHTTYQVVKDKYHIGPCNLCAFRYHNPDVGPCSKCDLSSKDAKIPRECYLKRIYKFSDPDIKLRKIKPKRL